MSIIKHYYAHMLCALGFSIIFIGMKKPMDIKERFFKHVNKTDTCWLWTGQISDYGYGVFSNKIFGRATHRISWKLHNGDIKDDLCVLHKCDVRNCVNPDHLFLGTHRDNVYDAISKNRYNRTRGEDVFGSKLKRNQVIEIRHSNEKNSVLAKRYGIAPSNIHRIKKGKAWKWLVEGSENSCAGTTPITPEYEI